MHTNGMKIAISIPEDIFQEIEKIAKEQKTSRSRVIAAAAREYVRKNETRRLIARLDAAYSEPDAPEDIARRKAMASYQMKRLKRKKA
ncbi:MAG: hypothetical protein A2Y69_06855 [Candidatus Aminicenantes bacterium RBG_13_59_9]|nr:MAG: hypothetical protein A2Y69_06855 [Candidatus Aminicenantes bacterium RBG_13_59_9]